MRDVFPWRRRRYTLTELTPLGLDRTTPAIEKFRRKQIKRNRVYSTHYDSPTARARRNVLSPSVRRQLPMLVEKVARTPSPTREMLSSTPPPTCFLPADHVVFSDDGKTARHMGITNHRITLVSADWVSDAHATKSRTWTITPQELCFHTNDLFIGFTEATHTFGNGTCVGVDCAGSTIIGGAPDRLTTILKPTRNLTVADNYHARATINLEKQTLVVAFFDATTGAQTDAFIEHLRAGIGHARLIVSFKMPEDRVTLDS